MTKPIQGSIVALITPFTAEGEVDYPALKRLIDWHIEQGTDCIGVVGTTGESPTITVDEQVEIIRVSVEHANKRVPIMAGCGANSTREAVALAQKAAAVGADCQLQVVPYYNKPTQAGQFLHFKAIAEAVDLPVYLYNVPGRTVVEVAPDTVLRLAEIKGIAGIKEASGNLDRANYLIAHRPTDFAIFSGDDPTAVALMLCGGDGNISVTANIAPKLMHDMCMAAIAGDAPKAQALHQQLMPLNKATGVQTNPIPVKWAAAQMGLCGHTLRLPLTELDASYHTTVMDALKTAGLVR